MHNEVRKPGLRGRRSPRVDIQGEVTIRFDAGSIVGSGENISLQGVFFTADGALPVTVQVAGRGDVTGKLVRDFGAVKDPLLDWDAGRNPAGLYFVRATQGSETRAAKISLLR